MPRKFWIWISIAVIAILIFVASVLFKDFILSKKVVPPPLPMVEYGIVTDSLVMVRDVVKPGQTLADIIGSFEVNHEQLIEVGEKSRGVIDMRKIRAGNNYTAMCLNDSLKTLSYFIYEINDTSYAVFDFGDSLHIYGASHEVKHETSTVSGTIQSSLWNAIEDAKGDINLVLGLANIYQWTIDFYALQKGDAFRIVYEKLSVNGKAVGMGKIHSALLTHSGKDYYAINFDQNDANGYFDLSGNNLRKAFLKAPLKFSRISSKFSNSRLHPVLRIRRPHHGVDYAAPKGTPVHSIGNGIVKKCGYSGGAGNLVTIQHSNSYTTSYMHLSGYGKGIRSGARVEQGQVIGYVGSTGLSTGPHLDFRVYKNGVAIDPLSMISPNADPIEKKNKPAFDSILKKQCLLLNPPKM